MCACMRTYMCVYNKKKKIKLKIKELCDLLKEIKNKRVCKFLICKHIPIFFFFFAVSASVIFCISFYVFDIRKMIQKCIFLYQKFAHIKK